MGAGEGEVEGASEVQVVGGVEGAVVLRRVAELLSFNGVSLEEGFESFDVDHDGVVSWSEFEAVCADSGVEGTR